MENECNFKFLPELRSRHIRSSTRLSLYQSIKRSEVTARSPSQEKLNILINECQNQVTKSKHLRRLITSKDRKLSQDFKVLQSKLKTKLCNENYITNAVKEFREEKKAFIYKQGMFISGSSSKGRFII